ncbi:MAG: metalloregulator ArsR/SmtB family transcription factor [Rhodospirillales bacterium]
MNENKPQSLASTLEALRAIAEHTRLRILLLCAHGELTVGDLSDILEQSQPRVSRHLKLMHEAGVLERHQEGQSVWFRAVTSGPLASLVREIVDQVPADDEQHKRDLARLRLVTDTWEVQAQSYFRKHYARWDEVRRELIDESAVDAALRNRFAETDAETLLDVGTGTGHVLRLLGPEISEGVGIDVSRDMLLAARAAIHNEGLPHCQVRQGDMRKLPFDDDSFDALSLHLVLHYAENPQAVIKECGRVTAPGGWIFVVDFAPHERREFTRQHGHRWPGFADEAVRQWLALAGFAAIQTSTIAQSAPDILFWVARKA